MCEEQEFNPWEIFSADKEQLIFGGLDVVCLGHTQQPVSDITRHMELCLHFGDGTRGSLQIILPLGFDEHQHEVSLSWSVKHIDSQSRRLPTTAAELMLTDTQALRGETGSKRESTAESAVWHQQRRSGKFLMGATPILSSAALHTNTCSWHMWLHEGK